MDCPVCKTDLTKEKSWLTEFNRRSALEDAMERLVAKIVICPECGVVLAKE